MCSVCQVSWYKYAHCGQFQATNKKLLKAGMGRCGYTDSLDPVQTTIPCRNNCWFTEYQAAILTGPPANFWQVSKMSIFNFVSFKTHPSSRIVGSLRGSAFLVYFLDCSITETTSVPRVSTWKVFPKWINCQYLK